jgi:hypothetical protein
MAVSKAGALKILFDRMDGNVSQEVKGMETRSDLRKAIDALENAGFHVDRAYEENNRDVGNTADCQEYKTGAICLRILPVTSRLFPKETKTTPGLTEAETREFHGNAATTRA